MSLLVTGSIGIDSVKTPFGQSNNCIGGSAIYFSMSASFFTDPVRLLGAIGQDCPFDLEEVFAGRAVDLSGLEIRATSKTFRWAGSYEGAMNEVVTDQISLNVLAEAPPAVPDQYVDSKFVFLANTAPALQSQLLDQIENPTFVAADTMNCWIESRRDELETLLKRIDAIIINDGEARMLSGEFNLMRAADKILEMGPEIVIIKKGEHGAMMNSKSGDSFILPAFPTAEVKDPTGAGDSFAGAFMGYIADCGKTDFATLKKAVAYGTIAASFTIEEFSLEGLLGIKKSDIDKRLAMLKEVTTF